MSRTAGYLAGAVIAALCAGGCGGDSPTSPDIGAAAVSTTETFTGTITAGGSAAYAFTVVQEGALQVTLTSLYASPLDPQSTTIRVGLGVPAGEGCTVSTSSVTTAASLSTQLLDRLSPGTYCVEVRDPDVLTRALTFIVRIVHT